MDRSQKGKIKSVTQPTTIIATMLGFVHPPFAVAASVRGIKINATAAESKTRPKKSNSYQVVFTALRKGTPLNNEGGFRLSFEAFRWFTNKANDKGRNVTGTIIAHMP